MRFISPSLHGIIDYLVVLFLWVAPSIFNLPELTATFTYILGGIHLVLTLFTQSKTSLYGLIPFTIHGWIELLVSGTLVGVAFFLGNKEGDLAKNFYLGFATAVFITWLFTDYKKG